MVYYQVNSSTVSELMLPFTDVKKTGIGTYDSHEVANPVTAKFAGIADMMVARSLAFHVMGKCRRMRIFGFTELEMQMDIPLLCRIVGADTLGKT